MRLLRSLLPAATRQLTNLVPPGWRFAEKGEDVSGDLTTPDPLHKDFTHLRDIYFEQDPDYSGRFTVPTLYDKKTNKIVSNESSEIIRMFYTAFDDQLPEEYKKIDLFPKNLQKDIEEMNEWVYNDINNGVYRSGFATCVFPPLPSTYLTSSHNSTEEAYTKAVTTLFQSLDRIESHLASSTTPYLLSSPHITEADIRLYTTIVRFDPVYVQHFKCNVRDIRSGYPHLHRWVRGLYWGHEAFGGTTEFEHIRKREFCFFFYLLFLFLFEKGEAGKECANGRQITRRVIVRLISLVLRP